MHYFTRIYRLWQSYRQRLSVRQQLHAVSRETCTEVIRQMIRLCDLTGLGRALRHTDPYIRREAVRGVGQLGGSGAVWLVRALNDQERTVAHAAAECIGHLLDRPVAADPDQTIAEVVAATRNQLADPRICSAITACLRSEDWMIRFHAASGLARISETSLEARQRLEELADDEHPWVKGIVAQALRRRTLSMDDDPSARASACRY